tara:strand:+ start:462 stop:755 length:294 start_codon:yes stop_codon:yes gene_type:complete
MIPHGATSDDSLQIELKQRDYDKAWMVWQLMYDDDVVEAFDNSHYGPDEIEKNSAYLPYWVLTNVFPTKKKATDYLKGKFGRNCFKGDNDIASIRFV